MIAEIDKLELARRFRSPFPEFHLPITLSGNQNEIIGKLMQISLPVIEFLMKKPKDMAEQLCLFDWECFRSVQAEEFAHGNWLGEKKLSLSPNIVLVTKNFNKMSRFVTFSILVQEEKKRRNNLYENWLNIVNYLLERQDYASAFAIYLGLIAGPLNGVLESLRGSIGRKEIRILELLEKLFDSSNNHECLRERQHSASLPCVPFMGVYLNHIVMALEKFKNIEEASIVSGKCESCKNDNNAASEVQKETEGPVKQQVCIACGGAGTAARETRWIFVDKYKIVVEVLRDVQFFKKSVYKFAKNPQIFAFLRNLPIIDEEILYSISSA
jgi:hypothetical protein